MAGKSIDIDALASVLFELRWASPEARHTERVHAAKVNFWRDIFPGESVLPGGLGGLLAGKRAGYEVSLRLAAGADMPMPDPALILDLPLAAMENPGGLPAPIPRLGRFYPRGAMSQAAGTFPQDMRPVRVVGLSAERFLADLNHPLAGRELTVSATVLDVRDKPSEMGGECRHVLECLADNGPGMQARWQGMPTDFHADDPFARPDQAPDAEFYAQPRLVQHMDAMARERLRALHTELLQPDPDRPGVAEPKDVLDLMASHDSHLPQDLAVRSLVGLGLNAEELAANSALSARVVHDLNSDPRLPFAEREFDAVLCSLSVEYLTRPEEVFLEVARVLRPGGVFLCSFSNRWFPGKAIRVWTELHEFERLGFVLDLFLRAELFEDIRTLSERGWPRPWDPTDRYLDRLRTADPLFAVWGRRGG